MPYDPTHQAIVDDEHLRLLSIGFYISAGFNAFYSLIGVFYAVMGGIAGLAVSKAATSAQQNVDQAPPPAFLGWIFSVIGIAIFIVLITIAALKLYAAHCLRHRRARTYCFVIGILTCLEIPYGTALGVFTILVLERPTVRALFAANRFAQPGLPPRV
jgi:hypothetical protein